tara:strand:+ start:261 stop:965 length:705 start_codon:yes stop_codon:yes gene_type:complete
MTSTTENTKIWYEKYYQKRGVNIDNIINNKGVLFQVFAHDKCLINCLSKIDLNQSSKVLDVGCGSGTSLLDFVKYGFNQNNLYGVDINDERIDFGKLNYPLLNLSIQDAAKLSFEENYFDFIFESTMFVQITDNDMSKKIANEMIRVTKKNGYIFILDWRYGKFRNSNYLACDRKRVKDIFRVGEDTEIVSVLPAAIVPPVGRFLSSHLSPFYFVVSKVFPFLVGQVGYLLQKR